MIDVDVVKSTPPAPFAGGAGWEIQYTKIGKHWQGVDKIWQESDKRKSDRQVALLLSDLLFLTGVQLSQTNIYQYNTAQTKKKINLLSRGGYLLSHKLIGSKTIPFYTVGPAAYKEDLKRDYVHGFYTRYGTTDVLKILSVNQLFIRFMKNFYVKEYLTVLPPYTAIMHILPKKYGNPTENQDKTITMPIISVRNYESDIENIKRQLPKLEDKAVIICATDDILASIHSSIKGNDNLRITTDDRLFRMPLSSAFFTANSEGYEEVTVGLFD